MEDIKNSVLGKSEPTQAEPVEHIFSETLATTRARGETLGQHTQTRPLSFAQERLWFLHHVDPSASTAYQRTIRLAMSCPLDRQALKAALNALARRYALLRTVFPSVAGEPRQVIGAPDGTFRLSQDMLTSQSTLETLIESEMREPFDLSNGPLVRGRLIQVSDEECVLLITLHDMISDHRSLGLLVRELSTIYAAFNDGCEDPLPVQAISYADYADGERERLDSERLPHELAFWKQYLAGAPELLQLPTCRPRPATQSSAVGRMQISFPAALTRRLREFSARHDVTLFTTVLSGWAVLLSRWSGQDEVVVGTIVANREHPETSELVGPLENTVAIRLQVCDSASVATLIEHVRDSARRALEYQSTPFGAVIEALRPARSLTYRPIVQVMLAVRPPLIEDALKLHRLATAVVEPMRARTAEDLSLSIFEAENTIVGTVEYASDIFERYAIERMMSHFETLLDGMVLDDRQPIGKLPLLSDTERQQVLIGFNGIDKAYPDARLIHQLFEEQVSARADAPAVVCGSENLSYRQLNCRANQLAHRLIALGVRPDDRVAIYVERGLQMVVGLLGILKAGGAYLPLELDHPADRLTYVLNDSAPVALVTQARLVQRIAKCDLPVVLLETDDETPALSGEPAFNPEIVGLSANNLAYVIYTSGSTGEPKGVLNQHDAAVCRLRWAHSEFKLTSDDRVLQKTPLGCDFSVWEIFLPLAAGALLVIARPGGHQDPRYLIDEIERSRITTLFFVPSMLQMFVDQVTPGDCSSVRRVLSSGEALPYALQTQFLLQLPHCELYNLYGPTEGTVDVTCWRCTPDRYMGIVPAGRPIENAKIYILDRFGQPVPIGVAGEMHIGGPGVARGYLRRPRLTAERFVPDPFNEDPTARMYKTGDLGRWLPDGNIEYVGRNDFQVKIRGFRVELEEIETHLTACEGVQDAVVIVREDRAGDRRLVAYVKPKDDAQPSWARLRSSLAARLPQYMIPNAYMTLDKLPLNTNGKLDRSALPVPDESAVVTREYEPPQGQIETALAGIWQEMLGLERVGRQDDFFELGGHSLLGMKLLASLTERFAVRFPAFAVFQHPTVESLASLIQRLELEAGAAPSTCPSTH